MIRPLLARVAGMSLASAARSAAGLALLASLVSWIWPHETVFVDIAVRAADPLGPGTSGELQRPAARSRELPLMRNPRPASVSGVLTPRPTFRIEIPGEDGVAGELSSVRRIDHLQGDSDFFTGVELPGRVAPRFRLGFERPPPVPVELTAPDVVVVRESLVWRATARYPAGDAVANQHDLLRSGGVFVQVGAEPWLELDLAGTAPAQRQGALSWQFGFCALGAFLLLVATSGIARLLTERELWIPLLAFASVISVALWTALALPQNHGPDEVMHFPSHAWYAVNLRPPSIAAGDPVFRDAVWQGSYVYGSGADLTYLLTARYANLASYWTDAASLAVQRVTQLLLVVIGLGLCARFAGVAAGCAWALSFAVMPQLAFSLTYLNGDASSFALGLLGVCLMGREELRDEVRLPVVAFLLANAKSNYLAIAPALFVPWLYGAVRRGDPGLRRTLLVGAAAAPIVFYRRLFNFVDERLAGQSITEEMLGRVDALVAASPDPFWGHLYAQHVYRRTLAGFDAWEWSFLSEPSWYGTTLRSFFGLFGSLDHVLPVAILGLAASAFGVVLVLAVRARAPLVGLAFALNLAAMIHYGLSVGPQAQGRYLFPFLAVVFGAAAPALGRFSSLLSLAAVGTLWALVEYTR